MIEYILKHLEEVGVSYAKAIVYLAVVAFMVVALSGCGGKPYLTADLGYKMPGTHYLLQPENGGGRNPTARFGAGLEWENGVRAGCWHLSQVRDGKPFNDRPETWMDVCEIGFKFGGVQ